MINKCYSNNTISLSPMLNDIGAAKVVHKLKALLCQCLTAWQHETLPWESNHKIGPKGELGNHDSTKYSASMYYHKVIIVWEGHTMFVLIHQVKTQIQKKINA